MRLVDAVQVVGTRSGSPAELVAVTEQEVVTISRGIEIEALGYVALPRLALVEPWAKAGMVVTRAGRTIRIAGVDRLGVASAWALVGNVVSDVCLPAEKSPGWLERVPCDTSDVTALSLLWSLQDRATTEPTMTELYEGVLLSAWLAGPMSGDTAQPIESGILALTAGDYRAFARAVGVPAPNEGAQPSGRLIVAALHALEVPVRWPVPGAPPAQLMADLRARVPPRWWFAHKLRLLGRPDLAELVMDSRAIA